MKRVLCLFLLLTTTAGCGAAAGTGAIAPESVVFAPALQVDLSAMERLRSGVYIRDLVEGSGPQAQPGRRVAFHVAGFLPNGTPFEQVAPPTPPVEFVMGSRTVIAGLEAGIMGMRPGGQRQLVVPAAQGYGSRGVGRVPPNSNLVFVIKLVSVR